MNDRISSIIFEYKRSGSQNSLSVAKACDSGTRLKVDANSIRAEMSSIVRFAVIVIVALALLTAHTTTASNSRSPRNNDISNIADAIKYLEDLDTYYGDRSRARFGKRAPLLLLLRQHLLENPDVARAIENPSADEPF